MQDPDVATRQFLSFLKRCLERAESPVIRETPFLALVDYDPHGIEILATYRFGSASQSSQSGQLSLNCLKWLGVHQSDVMNTSAKLMPFSAQDEKKMNALMEKTWLAATNDAGTWKQELERMQERKVKAEIEVMSDVAGGVKQFVAEKLARLAWL